MAEGLSRWRGAFTKPVETCGGDHVWHEHAFPPTGDNFPMCESSETDLDNRYDAIEDQTGRIFVWSVGRQAPMCVCADRETAALIARKLARE